MLLNPIGNGDAAILARSVAGILVTWLLGYYRVGSETTASSSSVCAGGILHRKAKTTDDEIIRRALEMRWDLEANAEPKLYFFRGFCRKPSRRRVALNLDDFGSAPPPLLLCCPARELVCPARQLDGAASQFTFD